MNSQESAPNIHGGRKEESGCKCWRGEPGPKGFTEAGYEFKIDFESPEELERILADIHESMLRKPFSALVEEFDTEPEQRSTSVGTQ